MAYIAAPSVDGEVSRKDAASALLTSSTRASTISSAPASSTPEISTPTAAPSSSRATELTRTWSSETVPAASLIARSTGSGVHWSIASPANVSVASTELSPLAQCSGVVVPISSTVSSSPAASMVMGMEVRSARTRRPVATW